MFATGSRVKLEPDGLALDAHNKRPPTAAERASGLITRDVTTEAELRRVAAFRELRGHLANRPPLAAAVDGRVNPAVHVATENTEDFYQHYLNFKVRPLKFRPCSTILGLDPVACRLALPEYLRANPQAAFHGQTTSLQDATQSLEALITEEYRSGGEAGLRECVIEKNLGLPRCTEGVDKYLWHYILRDGGMVQTEIEGLRISDNPDQKRSRGDLLRWMVEAQAFWSPRRTPLEASLKTFAHAVNLASESIVFIPTKQAGNWIESSLCSEIAGTVSAAWYHRFTSQVRFYKRRSTEAEWVVAIVSLFHPEPDPSIALKYWREAALQKDQFTQALLSGARDSTQFVVFCHLIRLAQHLHHHGDPANARWVLDFGKENFPNRFRMQAPEKPNAEPLLDPHHNRPLTKAEIGFGIKSLNEAAELRRQAALRELQGSRR
ncbi:hypothetical protein LTR22_002002 [Elasticomyces elasticus]|nr:hypothetical protein LTR22_002002 [Elasticomyces elasticus]KAK5768684.1 hypothetical protein LTS12_001109 [Elasticomyces elasticus]